jgi:hypothetical protein
MALLDTTTTTATAHRIGTSVPDLARLLGALAHFLNSRPDLPDLGFAGVDYDPTTASWGLDLLTADFGDEGRTAVDTWATALGAEAVLSTRPGNPAGTYAASTTLAGFPLRVWSTCLTPEPDTTEQ